MRRVTFAGLFVTLLCGPSLALPLGHMASPTIGALPFETVANGCGPGMYRTIAGDCRRNREVFAEPRRGYAAPPPCPRGYLRDPDPARPLCYPAY